MHQQLEYKGNKYIAAHEVIFKCVQCNEKFFTERGMKMHLSNCHYKAPVNNQIDWVNTLVNVGISHE
jgi:hypothetical protein